MATPRVLSEIRADLERLSDPETAANRTRFFKAGPGEYGEGDVFRGLTVPQVRTLDKKYRKRVTLKNAEALLKSVYHEDRLLALFFMVYLYGSGSPAGQESVFESYLANTRYINNWDLVDSSSRFIVGPHIENRPRDVLYKLAKSADLWERRIAVVATYHFIKKDDFDDILKLSELLLTDEHDLIHKATGWMLREAGNRNEHVLIGFLDSFCTVMPRTMLRYAIEKLPQSQRKSYLNR